MKNFFRIALLLFTSLGLTIISAQDDNYKMGLEAITEKAVEGQLEFLASDWMEGRETATDGIELAADYIASMFKVYGIEPAGDAEMTNVPWRERRRGAVPEEITTYFQNFSLIEYKPGEEQHFAFIQDSEENQSKIIFKNKTDFSVNTSEVGIETKAPVVFVGYGYTSEEKGYDDFEPVDVRGKFILRLTGFPGHRDTASAAYKKFKPEGRYSTWRLNRDKNRAAKKRGAVGIIEVDPDKNIEIDWAENFPLRFNRNYYEGTEYLMTGVHHYMSLPGDTLDSRLTEIKVTMRLANELIKGCNINFSRFEKEVSASLEPESKLLTERNIYVKTTVNSKIVKVRNVLGKIEGKNPGEIIVIGGHYDHVGANRGYIWNGSDDNASGTVGVMTLAKAFAASGIKPEKTIIFALWTGEEYGLYGSEYFADKYESIDDVILYLNYDMISRNNYSDTTGNQVSLEYTSAYPQIESYTNLYNDKLELGLNIEYDPSPKPGGGSDHSSFSAIDVPVFYFFTGFHPDYHGISDHADKANIPKMTGIIKLGFSDVWEVATSKERFSPAPVEKSDSE